MKTTIYKAAERGYANHGWLEARHSFSFANYYDPQKIRFGTLRVLNDDIIQPSRGFEMHPHEDMEIITIPLSGSLKHTDNMGHESIITSGEVQVMSAGRGVWHSEFNASDKEPINLLQTWVFPREKGLNSRYDQKDFSNSRQDGEWQLLVSPDGRKDSLWVNQDAFFSIIRFGKETISYKNYKSENGVFFFLIEGEVTIESNNLHDRDAIGIWDNDITININSDGNAFLLAIEIPMH